MSKKGCVVQMMGTLRQYQSMDIQITRFGYSQSSPPPPPPPKQNKIFGKHMLVVKAKRKETAGVERDVGSCVGHILGAKKCASGALMGRMLGQTSIDGKV